MKSNYFFLEIDKAEYLHDYSIKVYFTDKTVKMVDLKNHLNGEVFLPLRKIDLFKEFTIPLNTIEWSNGADFAPEFLYEIGENVAEIESVS